MRRDLSQICRSTAQSCILGRLRKQTLFSLAEANAVIADVLERINNHVMRRLGVSRRHSSRRSNARGSQACPPTSTSSPNGFARVSTDYHAEFKTFFYSVPHALIRQQVDIGATARMIEIFHRGKRVAVHQRR
ncbi:hypothetical protein QN219_27175 [Sinorhizobium sp. 7-81]|uniref:Mu transposase domain-containing protein n=1 Tax=Sinorhizobium sp. 8-89 TaxID=3049089 RepID=UPI0024C29B89|nr:hypothetical protein [Sinorhizobium sp. 8-89]MDK1493679.1 hypothetical protein [Sinorhizobium sp. 8-89]